ncbi:hypothetical protein H0A70_07820 [Alcaligenaceae bacterium]|nr:hypothetical protein [Alcaligenaceae bacterium]
MTDSVFGWLFTILFAFIVAFISGWTAAHQEVATECARQGGFYVNDKDFDCSVRRIEGEVK